MTYSKASGKVPKEHPIPRLSDAAYDIVERWKEAMKQADVSQDQLSIPIWIAAKQKMKITIEIGPETEAEYAIFKAQSQ